MSQVRKKQLNIDFGEDFYLLNLLLSFRRKAEKHCEDVSSEAVRSVLFEFVANLDKNVIKLVELFNISRKNN